ncbi:MAG TPA: hypothetical protein VF472_00875 [Burkholderiaceae bacterium]
MEEAEDPRRRILIQALSAGAAAMLLKPGEARADAVYSETPSRLPPGQSIYRIKGEVTVDGKEATLDTPIRAGSTVRTGADSEVIFVAGGHSMLVRENGVLVINGREEGIGGFLVSAMRLLQGKLLAVSRKQNYSISTPTATIGIRGTGLYVEAEPDLTYLCTCYGKTTVFARHDVHSQDTVVATHHNRPLYIAAKGKEGKLIRKAGFRSHTDEELLLIETLVGRTTPYPVPYDGPDNPYFGK